MAKRVSVVLIAFGVAGFSLAAGLAYLKWSARALPFDKVVWDAHVEHWNDKQHRRHRMADTLVEKGQLLGLTRAEVVARLGPPTRTSKFESYDLVYALGVERSLVAIDSEWLLLRIDNSGHVVNAEKMTD